MPVMHTVVREWTLGSLVAHFFDQPRQHGAGRHLRVSSRGSVSAAIALPSSGQIVSLIVFVLQVVPTVQDTQLVVHQAPHIAKEL